MNYEVMMWVMVGLLMCSVSFGFVLLLKNGALVSCLDSSNKLIERQEYKIKALEYENANSQKIINDYRLIPEGMKKVVKVVFTDENGDMTEQEFDADEFCKTEDVILIGKLGEYDSIVERSKHIMTYVDIVPIEESK